MSISNIARGHLLVPLCMIAVAWIGDAMAGTSECYAIKDADKRAYCLAQVKQDYGHCYRVKDRDQRNACLAETKGLRHHCYAVKSQANRKACLALTK